ncbi:MAG: hypothetical protein AAFR81_16250 [Chloroflexota bacterium]
MMNESPLHKRTDEASRIMSRLLASMPAATFEMETLSRLADIVASRQIPTAAMECRHRPRLLINPDFVAQYCKRDEHLFLLIMHELWHVMLAHTSLYPRMTKAQNIAFDAIINAGLLRRFHQPEYRGFFEALNPVDKFPHMLLRPPQGWRDRPYYPADIGPPGTRRVLRQLYPPPGTFRPTMPFYDEILDLIREDMRQKGELAEMPVLIGDHESNDPYKNPYLKDAMGRVVKKWPMKANEFSRGDGGDLDNWQIDAHSTNQEIRRAFSNVLKLALGQDAGEFRRKQRLPVRGITGKGVLPNARDRLIHARKRLGAPRTLWEQVNTYNARVPEKKVRAHVYLDVSGSMSNVLPYLLGLIVPYVHNGQAKVFQFSTAVEPLPLSHLRKGVVTTTGGTQIACVMDHIGEHRETVRRVLIVTDGYTGVPYSESIAMLKEDNTKVHVVLPAESPYDRDLSPIATSFTILPQAY